MKLEILGALLLALALMWMACRALSPVSQSQYVQPANKAVNSLEPALSTGSTGLTPVPGERRSETPSRPSIQPNTIEKNVSYCEVDGLELKMDIYYPGKMDHPAPAILYLHGGGWTSGDKREAERIWDIVKLFPGDHVLVSVNYRLAPTYRFPAQIVDVKCAVRHLRANAGRYYIDPERIGVMGVSAGGHLAALLGVSDETAGWDVGENLDQSSRVNAVVVMAGPADFTREFPAGSSAIARNVFGVTDRADPMLRHASPVTHVSAGDPPFLILQGEKDERVPAEQAQVLYEKLQSAQVPVDLVMIQNAGHSLQPLGGKMEPGPLEVALKIAAFFGKNL